MGEATLNLKHQTLNTALPPKCATQPVPNSIPAAGYQSKITCNTYHP
jgi:hypothetical protein